MEDNLQYEGQDLTFGGEVITFQGESEEPSDQPMIGFRTAKEHCRLRLLGYI